jgi:DNA-binding MarR family transcriptional regulator
MTGANPYALPAAALLRVLGRLRDRHPHMTVQQAMCLLGVARSPGVSQRELMESLELTDSSTSLTMAILSDVGTKVVDGLELIEMKPGANDRRVRTLHLSAKGRRLMDDILDDLKRTR